MKIKLGLSQKVIIGCVLLILVPLSYLGYRFYIKTVSLMHDQLADANLQTTQDLDDFYIDMVLDNLMLFHSLWADEPDLYKIVSDASVQEKYKAKWRSALLGYPEILSIYFGSVNGQIFITPHSILPEGYELRKRPWYTGAINSNGDLHWTQPYQDASTDNIIFSLSKHVKDPQGNVQGVLSLDVSLFEMSNLLKLSKQSPNGYNLLVTKDGNTIAGTYFDVVHMDFMDLPWSKEILSSEEGSFYDEFDGEKIIVSYVTNTITQWKLISITPLSDLAHKLDPLNDLMLKVIFSMGLWGLVVVTILVIYLRWVVINPVLELRILMAEAESGDLTVSTKYAHRMEDEITLFNKSFNHMIEGQNETLTNISITAGQLLLSANQTEVVAKLSSETAVAQSQAMSELSKALEDMSHSINEVMLHMGSIVKNVDHFNNAMQDMGLSASDIAENTIQTSESISDVVNALKQFEMSIEMINARVREANSKGQETIVEVFNGQTVVDLTIAEMDTIHASMCQLSKTITALAESAGQVGDILEVIDDLAEQTNLLAMNASIEAARAGEHGKGFGVVATAIGRLAEKSKASTKDIEKIVKTIGSVLDDAVKSTEISASQIDNGVNRVKQTDAAFRAINVAISETLKLLMDVGHTTEEQLTFTQKIMTAAITVNDVTMQVSASTEEQLATIEELIHTTEEMKSNIDEVFASGTLQATNSLELSTTAQNLIQMTEDVTVTSENVESIARELNKHADELMTRVSKFKLTKGDPS